MSVKKFFIIDHFGEDMDKSMVSRFFWLTVHIGLARWMGTTIGISEDIMASEQEIKRYL